MPAIIYPPATINGQEFTDPTGIVWKWKAAGSSGKWGHKAQIENVTLSGVQTITGRKTFAPPTGMAALFRSTNDYGADIQSVSGTALNAYSFSGDGAEIGSSSGIGAFITGGISGARIYTSTGTNHAEFGTSGIDQSFIARLKGAFGWVRGAFTGRIQPPDTLGANAVWTLPGSTGTLALLSDISSGNAGTVTNIGNLTGVVTSVNRATSIANGAITNVMLANGAVANLAGTNTGNETAASIATALNAGTQDTTAADTDRIAVTSPAGGWMLLSALWTWIKAKIDLGQTWAGNHSFTGQISSSGSTSTASSTNVLNMATNDARYVTLSGGQIISNVGAANVGFTVKGAVSQTAALQKWQDSGGADLAHLGINGRLGLGTSSPSYPIHVEKNANDTLSAVIAVKNLSAGNIATAEIRAENNLGYSGTLFKTGSGYSNYKTIGPNALGFYNNQSAGNISILNDFGSGNITLTAGGSSTAHVTIAPNGDATFANKIIASSVVRLKNYTVATLPAGPTQGDTAFVTDALTPAYLAPAMGGGAIVAPVIFNGTQWVTH